MIASQHWRRRAQQARASTNRMRGAHAKVAMMLLAMNYEMLAVRTDQREVVKKLMQRKIG